MFTGYRVAKGSVNYQDRIIVKGKDLWFFLVALCNKYYNISIRAWLVVLNKQEYRKLYRKECVARMTCLYKNDGAVSCVGGNVCIARCTRYFGTKLHGILPRADINRNCNTFFTKMYKDLPWYLSTLLKGTLNISLLLKSWLTSAKYPSKPCQGTSTSLPLKGMSIDLYCLTEIYNIILFYSMILPCIRNIQVLTGPITHKIKDQNMPLDHRLKSLQYINYLKGNLVVYQYYCLPYIFLKGCFLFTRTKQIPSQTQQSYIQDR